MKTTTCCICGKKIKGFGHNPYPLGNDIKDRCCTECNAEFVITARIAKFQCPKNKKEVKIGDTIVILWLKDEPNVLDYVFKKGEVENIDSIGQLHGTWGGLAINPDVDEFVIL